MKWNRRQSTLGFTFIEVLVVVGIILLLIATAIPSIREAQKNTTETVVMREIQAIHQAQTQYQSQFGEFASTLAELGPPMNGNPGPKAAKLIPGSLASGEKDGYVFVMTHTPGGFTVNANPIVFGKNGRRTFYLDDDGIVHQNWGPEPATASSPEVGDHHKR